MTGTTIRWSVITYPDPTDDPPIPDEPDPEDRKD